MPFKYANSEEVTKPDIQLSLNKENSNTSIKDDEEVTRVNRDEENTRNISPLERRDFDEEETNVLKGNETPIDNSDRVKIQQIVDSAKFTIFVDQILSSLCYSGTYVLYSFYERLHENPAARIADMYGGEGADVDQMLHNMNFYGDNPFYPRQNIIEKGDFRPGLFDPFEVYHTQDRRDRREKEVEELRKNLRKQKNRENKLAFRLECLKQIYKDSKLNKKATSKQTMEVRKILLSEVESEVAEGNYRIKLKKVLANYLMTLVLSDDSRKTLTERLYAAHVKKSIAKELPDGMKEILLTIGSNLSQEFVKAVDETTDRKDLNYRLPQNTSIEEIERKRKDFIRQFMAVAQENLLISTTNFIKSFNIKERFR